MSDIAELLERVRKATGPDRKADLDIHCLLFPNSDITKIATGHWHDQRDWGVTEGSVWNRTESGSASIPMPRYTASIDAITALIERELPVNTTRTVSDPSGCSAQITWWPEGLSGETRVQSDETHQSLPLAMVCAFLSAKLAQVTE